MDRDELLRAICRSAQLYGGEVKAEQKYSNGDTNFNAQLSSIKQANPDVLFIPGYYNEVGTIARQARGVP